MKSNSSKLFPRVAIISFMIMLSSFFGEKYYFKNNTAVTTTKSKTVTSVGSPDVSVKSGQLNKPHRGTNTEKAYIESTQIDPVTNQATYKMHIPNGKRLYNEEKMREIASDVPIDSLISEDSSLYNN